MAWMVFLFTLVTTSAWTLPDSLSLMPTTAVLPTLPRPAFSFLSACLFFSKPPKYASSISTSPENAPCGSKASRMRCAMCQAAFWVMPSSRCSRIELTPLRLTECM